MLIKLQIKIQSMLIEIVIVILLGTFIGIFTGLTPGLHINLVAAIALSFAPALLNYFSPFAIAIILISMSITHVFLDIIPSIFLGAPDSETALMVLPGHRLLLQGEGYEAVFISVYGAFLGIILLVLLFPLFIFIFPFFFQFFSKFIFLLLIVVLILVLREERKLWAFSIVVLASILGYIALKLPIKEPLLPLLGGLFGASTLFMSIFSKVRVPQQQKMGEINLEKENVLLLGSGIFSAGFMNLFPGLGPAQAAIMSSSFFKKLTARNYLFLIGCINAVSMLMALITLYTIGKARNGSIAVAGIFLGEIGFNELVFILIIALVVSCLAVILVIRLIPIFILLVSYVNYQILCFGILFIIIFFVILFSGLVGVIILITGTSIGIIAHTAKVGKHHAMSCLIIPIVLNMLL